MKGLFAENIRYVRAVGFAVLGLATLPGVLHEVEPYFCSGEDHTVYLIELLVLFLPLLTAASVCAVALGIALQQNRWIAVMREERRHRNISTWEDLRLCLPGIRYWFLGHSLAGELPRSSHWLPWGMIAGAALYWITELVIGPLSPIPFCALAVSAGCWLGAGRRIADVPMERREWLGWQLSAPGGNYRMPPKFQKEWRRDTFTVLTEWPAPAPPEPNQLRPPCNSDTD